MLGVVYMIIKRPYLYQTDFAYYNNQYVEYYFSSNFINANALDVLQYYESDKNKLTICHDKTNKIYGFVLYSGPQILYEFDSTLSFIPTCIIIDMDSHPPYLGDIKEIYKSEINPEQSVSYNYKMKQDDIFNYPSLIDMSDIKDGLFQFSWSQDKQFFEKETKVTGFKYAPNRNNNHDIIEITLIKDDIITHYLITTNDFVYYFDNNGYFRDSDYETLFYLKFESYIR